MTDFGLSKIGLVNCMYHYLLLKFILFCITDTVHCIEDAWSKDKQFIDQEVYGTPDYIAPEVILGQPYGMALYFIF